MATQHLERVLRQIRDLADPLGDAGDAELLQRFADGRDDAAFAVLLSRHGPMVLAVGRRMLPDVHDTEDVFQATFMLLARKAGSLRKPESVASWLHGVARRLALKVKTRSARRLAHEQQAADMRSTEPTPDAVGRELQEMLDEALGQVPAKYRRVLVLCHLEGLSHEDAARELGCRPGTVKSWAFRGRELLRDRLARRGMVLTAAALATALAVTSAPAALPMSAGEATFRAALRFASGEAAASLVSGRAAALVETGLQLLVADRLRNGAILVVPLLLLATSAAVLAVQALPTGPPEVPAAPGIVGPPPVDSGAGRTVPADPNADPLPSGAVARLGTRRFSHSAAVEKVTFSPDGKGLVSWSHEALWFWEAGTGKLSRKAEWGYTRLAGLGCFPGGKSLAVLRTGEDQFHLWDFAGGEPTPKLEPWVCAKWPKSFAIAGGGKLVAVGERRPPDEVGCVMIYEACSGKLANDLKELRRFDTGPGGVRWMALSPDGNRLLGSGEELVGPGSEPRLWDTTSGELLSQLPVRPVRLNLAAVPAVFSPDGRILVLATEDTALCVWDVEAGRELRRLSGHHKEFACMGFSSDGQTLAVGGFDPALRLWDVATWEPIHVVKQGSVRTLSFSADGRTLASGGVDHRLRVWDVRRGREIMPGKGHGSWIRATALAADGRTAATADQDGTLRLWEARTGRELRRIPEARVSALAFSPDGRFLAGDDGQTYRRWDVASGEEVRTVPRESKFHPRTALVLTADGRGLAASWSSKPMRVWEVRDEGAARVIAEIPLEENLAAVAFSPDGRLLATTSGRPAVGMSDALTVRLWDVASGRGVGQFEVPVGEDGGAHHSIRALAFSPDGKSIATAAGTVVPFPRGANDPEVTPPARVVSVRLWDVATGKGLKKFEAEQSHFDLPDAWGATCVAFSPDGRSLVVGEADHTVALYEVETGKVRRRFAGHQGPVDSLAFSGDGRLLVSSSGDLTALVWDLTNLPGGTGELRPAPGAGSSEVGSPPERRP